MATLSRKERDNKRRRQEILDTALPIFAAQGFHGTTMAQISQGSQYPLGTIYKYFPGKKEIYYDLVMEKIYELGRILVEISSKSDISASEKLKRSLFAKAMFYRTNSEFVRIYISERSNIDSVMMPKLNQKVNRRHEKMIALFQAIFEEGIDSGEFKTFPAGEMAEVFADIAHSASWSSLFRGEEEAELKKRLSTVFKIITQGISTKNRPAVMAPKED